LTNRIISVHTGVFGLDIAGEASKEHSVLECWSCTHANLSAPFKLI